jgi:hypothetical protein
MFPKSLRAFADRKIVGINYDLLAKDSRPAQVEKPTGRKGKLPAAKPARAPAAEEKENLIEFEPPPKDTTPERSVAEARAPAEEKVPEKPAAPKKPAKVTKPKDAPESRKKAERETRTPTSTRADRRVLDEVEKAMKELRGGKPVVAYERLEALVKTLRSTDES